MFQHKHDCQLQLRNHQNDAILYDLWNSLLILGINGIKEENRSTAKNLGPSHFVYGCKCGHGLEYRDKVLKIRKKRNVRPQSITIQPKIAPIKLKLI